MLGGSRCTSGGSSDLMLSESAGWTRTMSGRSLTLSGRGTCHGAGQCRNLASSTVLEVCVQPHKLPPTLGTFLLGSLVPVVQSLL